jgi:hypothetical protein
MVATHILLAERAEALERLRDALVDLDGADEQRVHETSERARNGHVGAEYMTALFLAEVSQVLADQEARIEALESRVSEVSAPKRTRKK